MEILKYTLRHNKFYYLFLFNFILYVCYFFISMYPQEVYIEFATAMIVFLISFPGFFYWQSTFQRAYDTSFIRFRMMSKYHMDIEKQYCIFNLLMGCIYGFIVGFMIFLISGGYLSKHIFVLAFANMLFIIAIYALLSSIYSRLYLHFKRADIPTLITISVSLIFSVWLFLNRILIDLYMNFNYYCFSMMVVIGLIVLMMGYSKKQRIVSHIGMKKIIPYVLLVLVYIFQTGFLFEYTFENYITFNLRIVELNDMGSIIRYIAWNIPRIIILTCISSIFIRYIDTTYQYFKIRERSNVWFKIIMKKVLQVYLISLLIQLCAAYVIRGMYPSSWNDIILLTSTYLFMFSMSSVYMLIYLICKNTHIIMYIIGGYFTIGLLLIQFKNDFLIDLLLQQRINGLQFVILIIMSCTLLLVNMHVLKTMKE